MIRSTLDHSHLPNLNYTLLDNYFVLHPFESLLNSTISYSNLSNTFRVLFPATLPPSPISLPVLYKATPQILSVYSSPSPISCPRIDLRLYHNDRRCAYCRGHRLWHDVQWVNISNSFDGFQTLTFPVLLLLLSQVLTMLRLSESVQERERVSSTF
jgi:hypothetical protein